MDEEMLEAAVQFVDELVELGVLPSIDEGLTVLTNAPLFVVGKDGQPGQWRVIADMLRGGQNDCVGQDPVFMPRIAHIVDQMYTEGYSAVVDLSKFFYNFPTHPDDRPYLGLLHPKTAELLTYYGLAMGAGNSPAIACRIGLAFVRLVKEKFGVFQGEARANCYWTGLQANGFDPKLGYGFILTSNDGGAVHIWVWVDDFLIHGPTHEKTARGLQFFLDTAVDCGFLFHPKKLVPPQQVVKYCGFLFDTTAVPCLRIPEAKKERALAICDYLIQSPKHKRWSRLGLAVAVGVLESLTEATPRRLGHTHLKEFHTIVHPPGLGNGAAPYYTTTFLNSEVLDELHWWRQFLTRSEGRFVRGWEAATLVPTFGDGSGTGTGGTIQLPNCDFEMWRGKWKPSIYIFPSVWKELATLKETLLRIKESPHAHQVIGTTVFYFTDNSGVYWIATTGSSRTRSLHKLISEIRLLELDLQCVLQVVHVPGRVLITQGTDGLSRGVWMSALQNIMDSDRLTQAIFDPVPFDMALVWTHLPQSAPVTQYRSWNQPWTASLCLHQTTVWCPPPELARQLLTFLLNSWVECPFTTSALLFVPRVVEASWQHMSRWTRLPLPPPLGMPPKPHLCAGCQRGFSRKETETRLQCTFSAKGFGRFRACGSTYHRDCFRAGEPFKTRRLRDEGLTFPRHATWPNFVCEACTVRQYLQRELVRADDLLLLMLERVRMLDIISSWAKGTHASYKSKLSIIRQFETNFAIQVLQPTALLEPPSGPDISPSCGVRNGTASAIPPRNTTEVLKLPSALAQSEPSDRPLPNTPQNAYMSQDNKVLYQDCRPTDSLSFHLFAKGMVARMGDYSRPSVALLDRHIRALDHFLDRQFYEATSDVQRRDIALAGLANLVLWLGWLRSAECFGLNWEDCSILEPEDYGQADLPRNCGMVTFRLNPVTKSERTRTADVIIAHTTRSGLCTGKWFRRALSYRVRRTGPVFCHANGIAWTSFFFRSTYLYPSLYKQRLEGDPLLLPFDGTPSNTIESRFWSLHCYRRGGRSHVSRGDTCGGRRLTIASETQVYKHGRWRLRRSNEKVGTSYRKWKPRERVKITLYCH
ncbi:unnamed protein product [Cylindrotheca closterium]|uniref:Reverse transcriptase domain-containing protein n=1 Tax=Cylindrotheca closterium TaxID=2856 RepID=A0AAD2CUU6_9STRA|nr:unnamed protein product [Cylindrotheca closterium]